MSVDKRPEDLTNFDTLATEADGYNAQWKLVFVATLGGQDGSPPSPESTDASLDLMIKTIQSGGNVSRYLVFDREGELLTISLQ